MEVVGSPELDDIIAEFDLIRHRASKVLSVKNGLPNLASQTGKLLLSISPWKITFKDPNILFISIAIGYLRHRPCHHFEIGKMRWHCFADRYLAPCLAHCLVDTVYNPLQEACQPEQLEQDPRMQHLADSKKTQLLF